MSWRFSGSKPRTWHSVKSATSSRARDDVEGVLAAQRLDLLVHERAHGVLRSVRRLDVQGDREEVAPLALQRRVVLDRGELRALDDRRRTCGSEENVAGSRCALRTSS